MPIRGKALAISLSLLSCLVLNTENVPAAEPANLLQDFGRGQLLILTQQRCIVITAFVANTNKQRAQGLMHIRSMPQDEGMIFLYPKPARISMWMKNTLIPLDMFFLEGSGQVVTIAAHTEPMSEKIISSDSAVVAVLELNAGAAAYFGIAPGDWINFFSALN
jgi:uncharacterized membrane protein (UPF0127 family)